MRYWIFLTTGCLLVADTPTLGLACTSFSLLFIFALVSTLTVLCFGPDSDGDITNDSDDSCICCCASSFYCGIALYIIAGKSTSPIWLSPFCLHSRDVKSYRHSMLNAGSSLVFSKRGSLTPVQRNEEASLTNHGVRMEFDDQNVQYFWVWELGRSWLKKTLVIHCSFFLI